MVSPYGNTPIHKVNVSVGIKEYDDSESIFPNPAKDYLYFTIEQTFEIMDIQGRVLFKSETAMQSVNISRLKPGIYFIKFEDNRIRKFVKK
jgi:hypothetical protein